MSFAVALSLAVAPAPVQSCQAQLGPLYEGVEETALPGRVDGRTIAGPAALLELRRQRGETLIVVVGGSFPRADFSNQRLHNICFLDTDLSGSDWRGAVAPGIGFVRAKLERANLGGARMRHILLRAPDLNGADASGADLSEGRLDGGWDGSMEDVRLDRANLTSFRFECGITIDDGCPIQRRLSLRGADLTGASLYSWWVDADYAGARLDRTEVALHQLQAMRTADLAGPVTVRGGDASVELPPRQYQTLVPHIIGVGETRASFDCAAASTAVERQICGEHGDALRSLDAQVASLYRRARAADPAVADNQQAWLRERDRCGANFECIVRAYARRKAALLGSLGPPQWARPGAALLFVAPEVEFDDAFRSDPLYLRLLPAIIGGASGAVGVRVNGDGTLDAGGWAIGGNAHSCSLGARGLRFDRANGWYGAPFEETEETPSEWRGRPMPVLRFWDDRAEVYRSGIGGWGDAEDPRSSDYASCGARASFSEMVRVPATEAEVARLLEESQNP